MKVRVHLCSAQYGLRWAVEADVGQQLIESMTRAVAETRGRALSTAYWECSTEALRAVEAAVLEWCAVAGVPMVTGPDGRMVRAFRGLPIIELTDTALDSDGPYDEAADRSAQEHRDGV